MISTQNFLPIENIDDGIVLLKDGSVSLILSTSAVNFGLLFETEQIAIIESFAGFLNSLSFPVQIVIRSERLDISSYLTTLDVALKKQTNPLLSRLTERYRKFVESLIKEKNVLDKQFFVCLNVTSAELGLLPQNSQERTKKALTILKPRKDHVVRQLTRIGLKVKELNSVELIKLFFGIFNSQVVTNNIPQASLPIITIATPPVRPNITRFAPASLPIQPINPKAFPTPLSPINLPPSVLPPAGGPNINIPRPSMVYTPYTPPQPTLKRPTQPVSFVSKLAPPFIVEELPDDLGS